MRIQAASICDHELLLRMAHFKEALMTSHSTVTKAALGEIQRFEASLGRPMPRPNQRVQKSPSTLSSPDEPLSVTETIETCRRHPSTSLSNHSSQLPTPLSGCHTR